jgi:phospholipid/cholesterol/gamma-HCH transport system permease protein
MMAPVRGLGFGATRFVAQLGSMAVFAGNVLRTLATPPVRFARVVQEVYETGVLSVAIVCGSGLAVGAVLGLQGYNTLVRFGAEESLGAVVGLSLIRELGPVLTGLLVTGRAGSAMAAEIASMLASQQLDGLRMMSIDPIHLVVAPKALAMFLVMPLLSALFIATALFGGYLVGVTLLGLDPGTYFTSLESSVDFENDVAGSGIKALAFGALVGLVATYRGSTAAPTAAGVSAATTSTVVVASVSILILDYVITALWDVYP